MSPKRTERCRHLRRLDQQPLRGRWRVACDCGWDGWADGTAMGRPRTGTEISDELDRLFVAHLPDQERELYLLIDQRQVACEDDHGQTQMVARGQFIMPIGTPCLLTSWYEKAGIRWGRFLVPQTGHAGDLPVGEIRTADNRVFRLDCPA